MSIYVIKSPSGSSYRVTADSFYHAIQRVKKMENYLFAENDYYKLNKL